tara:strand:+ start:147 stop:272 length:126 start_codon:yes stop_codon:yes gene_type:complete
LFCPAGQNNKSGNEQPDPQRQGGTTKQAEGARPKQAKAVDF